MKINGIPGEFAFKALFKNYWITGSTNMQDGWRLSEAFYFSEEDVKSEAKRQKGSYKWPVEVYDDGSVYCPDESEVI